MRNAPLTAEAIVLHAGVLTFPVPTQPLIDGNDITPWRHGGVYSYDTADLFFTADKACTLDGLALYGTRNDGSLTLLGLLNNAETIVVQKNGAVVVGQAMLVHNVGLYKRLIIGGVNGAVAPSDATAHVTVTATPVVGEDN